MPRLCIAIACLLSMSLIASGQETPPEDLRQAAKEAIDATQWERAERLLMELVDQSPDEHAAWYQLGRCRRELGKLDERISALQQAVELGETVRGIGHIYLFELARALAAKGETGPAFYRLGQALAAAPEDDRASLHDIILSEPEFESLRDDPSLETLLRMPKPTVAAPRTPDLPPEPMGWAIWEPEWVLPDPAVVKDEALRASIKSTGLPWRVLDRIHGIEMLLVPPGTYVRGGDPLGEYGKFIRPNEQPRHKVQITKPFYIGRNEISRGQWKSVMVGPPAMQETADAAGSLLSQAVVSSVLRRVPDTEQPELEKTVTETIRDLVSTGKLSPAELESPEGAAGWDVGTRLISAAVEKVLQRSGRAGIVRSVGNEMIGDAVGEAITTFVQEQVNASRSAVTWFSTRSISDQTEESWQEMQVFLDKTRPLGFALPSEGQWEYACRIGGGAIWTRNAVQTNRAVRPPPAVSGLGLFNMLGGAAEWTIDYYLPDTYSRLPEVSIDPVNEVQAPGYQSNAAHLQRVIRGGCNSDEFLSGTRREEILGGADLGFRVIRVQEPAAQEVKPYISPDVEAFDAPMPPMAWAETIAHKPDPKIVTDPALREAISNTKLPWSVRDRATGIEFLMLPPGKYQVGFDDSTWREESGLYLADWWTDFDRMSNERWWNKINFNTPHVAPSGLNRRREVEILKILYMSRFEVVGEGGSAGSERDIASRYAKKVGCRIATEDEWEAACRAGNLADNYAYRMEYDSDLVLGDKGAPRLEDVAVLCMVDGDDVCKDTSYGNTPHTRPGQMKPNGFGFYDMIGRLPELCVATLGNAAWVYKGSSARWGSLLGLNPWGREFNFGEQGSEVGFRLVREP